VARGVATRFTFDTASNEWSPVWSPDGRRLAFASDRIGGKGAIFTKDVGSGAVEELLQQSTEAQRPNDWSPDGRYLLYEQGERGPGKVELWVEPLFGDRKPSPVVQGPYHAGDARFSPDGRWIAYDSDESGVLQVYITRFAAPSTGSSKPAATFGKWQVSPQGGGVPKWRGDGRELFYIGLDDRITTVAVQGRGDQFEIGSIRSLFAANMPPVGVPYDVTGDGRRFIVNAGEASSSPITLLLHWDAGLNM
jgi:Tol biopolymer transport system component